MRGLNEKLNMLQFFFAVLPHVSKNERVENGTGNLTPCADLISFSFILVTKDPGNDVGRCQNK